MEKKEIRIMASKNNDIEVADFAKQLQCAMCSKYEHFCRNCGRYEPIDSDEGWCGSTKVSSDSYCSSWR